MSNPTTPFSWQMPTATDLVTDLPADFEVFGQAVATSLADLLGGTTGQVLSKTSNIDMDFTWVAANPGDITGVTAGTGISGGGTSGTVTVTNDMATTITASGDIVVGTGSGTYDNLPIGTTGQILTADTTVSPYKVKWATASSGALTKIAAATFSNVAEVNVDSVFSSTYKSYIITIKATNETSDTADFYFRTRNNTPSTNTQNYSGGGQSINRAGTNAAMASDNAAQWRLTTDMGSTGVPSHSVFTINVNGVTGSTERPGFTFQGLSGATTPGLYVHGAVYSDQSNIRGFNLSASTGNITGDYSVYGLEK